MNLQRFTGVCAGALVGGAALFSPAAALAQGADHPGVRARGMAGAFTAVADDATAVWWNPAGLATLRFFDASLDIGQAELDPGRDRPIDQGGATRWRQGGVFLAVPVFGLSVNRTTTTTLLEPARPAPGGGVATAEVEGGRQDHGLVSSAFVLRATHLGVTLVQSVSDTVVVGGTVRLIRGRAGGRLVSADLPRDAALELAEEAGGRSGTRVDADLGVVAVLGRVRLGAAARNLGAASFETPDGVEVGFDRQVRVGVAVGGEPGYGLRPWQVAADADLLTADGPDGERRALAVGAERWWAGRRLALRGGAQVQTVGDARPSASLGGSVAVWSGLLVEVQVTEGGDRVARGWGVSARVAF